MKKLEKHLIFVSHLYTLNLKNIFYMNFVVFDFWSGTLDAQRYVTAHWFWWCPYHARKKVVKSKYQFSGSPISSWSWELILKPQPGLTYVFETCYSNLVFSNQKCLFLNSEQLSRFWNFKFDHIWSKYCEICHKNRDFTSRIILFSLQNVSSTHYS